MQINGRGSVANVKYTGEEAAAEIQKLLAAVIESEDEFERWEALVLKASELEGGVTRNSSPSAIELVRNVYDCFLAKFPLFYGYWKKYADLEFAIGGTETAEMVYERGVSCVPNAVELWSSYCGFKMDTCHDSDIIRELFERGAHFVGLDFQSQSFWDKYIEFEERVQEPGNVTKINRRAFQRPNYQFQRYYEKFRNLITTRPFEDLAEPELLATLKAAVDAENQGFERPPLEIERQLRGKIDAYYYEMYMRVQQEVSERWPFENAIKRGYFHVTPLEDDDLDNWRKYLDYEEQQGNYENTCFLYERCLVTCALYEEFWLRYARWLLYQGKEEDARLVYMRASCHYVPISQPTVRLNWARLEEKMGQYSDGKRKVNRTEIAHNIHLAILDQLPNHVETVISLAGLERRHKGEDAAVRLLQTYIDQRDTKVGGLLVAEQARILWQCKHEVKEAREVFHQNQDMFLDSADFWLKWLEFETAQLGPNQHEAYMSVKAAHNLLREKGVFSDDEKKSLSHRYMEYLLARCDKDAADEYLRLDMAVNGPYPKKHNLQPSETTDEPPAKKARKSR